MTADDDKSAPAEAGQVPLWALLAMTGAGFLLMLGGLTGMVSFPGALFLVLSDGIMAGLILLAAGGYGYLVYRRFGPAESSRLLVLATSCAAGLLMLSTIMLVVGSYVAGSLTPYVWWPVIVVGGLLAMAQAHGPLGRLSLPKTLPAGSLLWVVLALAAGAAVAGAVVPPWRGLLGGRTMDWYDILEYHLQLPREFYQVGQISTLDHNVYSHYPLGTEMLFLLAMCLRGGAYEGMYLAQMVSGLFGVVLVAGVYGALAAGEGQATSAGWTGRFRAIAAAALLASAPWVIYFAWLAMEELPEMCFLGLGLLWLGRWLRRPALRSAGWIGAMLGGACTVKYLSVGFVAAPILLVMAGACARAPRRLAQAARAGAICLAIFSPWLIRNLAATDNPVFPLATELFGQGPWSQECAQRWRDGHAPGFHPPVPVPPEYQPPEQLPSRRMNFAALWVGDPPYNADPALGQLLVIILAGTILAMFIRPRRVGGWDWGLLAVLGVQLGVWVLFTRGMPGRFISVAVVPISLLASGGLERLSRVAEAPFLRQAAAAGGRWGLAPAGLLLLASVGLNLKSAGQYYRAETALCRGAIPAGVPGEELSRQVFHWPLAQGQRLMLVGEAPAFYYPPGASYATVFDEHPLERVFAGRGSVTAELRRMNVAYVLVSWMEIKRLARTYGWPAELSAANLEAAFAGWPVLEQYYEYRMTPAGPVPTNVVMLTIYAAPWTTTGPATGPAGAASGPTGR